MSDIYTDGTYAIEHPGYHTRDSPWKAGKIQKMIQRNDLRPKRIVEVGCGAGEVLVRLRERMNDPEAVYFGYEISPQAYELARKHEGENLRFRCADLLDENGESFDLLLCIDVFEHVPDYLGFIAGLQRKAEYKLFKIPLDMAAQMVARPKAIMNVRREVGHLHYFMKDTALETLRHCGLEVIDWFYCHSGVENPKSQKARLLRWPRRLLLAIAEDATVRILGGSSLMVLAR